MEKGLLSCIVLTYNNGNSLFETIDSILDQTYDKIELIVSDDCGKDFDLIQINNYVLSKKKSNIYNVIIHQNSVNVGTVKNINNAIHMSSGEYLKFIAGDDYYPNSNVFAEQVNFLKNNANKSIVVGNSICCDKNKKILYRNGFGSMNKTHLLRENKANKLYSYFTKKNVGILSTQMICFKRDFFLNYGLFDERFRLLEDMPMGKRIILENVSIGFINHDCVCHRYAGGLSTSNSAFDVKKIAYYQDLFNESLIHKSIDKKMIGIIYSVCRYSICKMRIEICNKELQGTKYNRILMYLKYLIPILYHVFNHPSSLSQYKKTK